jgi:hypothetical protein
MSRKGKSTQRERSLAVALGLGRGLVMGLEFVFGVIEML